MGLAAFFKMATIIHHFVTISSSKIILLHFVAIQLYVQSSKESNMSQEKQDEKGIPLCTAVTVYR